MYDNLASRDADTYAQWRSGYNEALYTAPESMERQGVYHPLVMSPDDLRVAVLSQVTFGDFISPVANTIFENVVGFMKTTVVQ